MNIINSGGWYVGNGAVIDWLDGFDEYTILKGDFNITRAENGIMDLICTSNHTDKIRICAHLKKYCYKGILRTSKKKVGKYTKNILKTNKETNHELRYTFNVNLLKYVIKYERLILKKEIFDDYDFWKLWLNDLKKINGKKTNNKIVFQNPIFYDETFSGHSNIWQRLFEPYKLIFVHRNPLDQFADIVNNGGHEYLGMPRFHGDTVDLHPTDRFLNLAKKIYHARLRMADYYDRNSLIILSFEDFILNHEYTSSCLKSFLNIKVGRKVKKKSFDLERSKKNIGIGKGNVVVQELLKNKSYVIDELNDLRQQLSSHENSI